MCEEKLNQFTKKQDGAKQVTVIVDLENALFAGFHIAERCHVFKESTAAYVENFCPKVHLLQNGNLQSSSSFDAGFNKFNSFLKGDIFLVPRVTRF